MRVPANVKRLKREIVIHVRMLIRARSLMLTHLSPNTIGEARKSMDSEIADWKRMLKKLR